MFGGANQQKIPRFKKFTSKVKTLFGFSPKPPPIPVKGEFYLKNIFNPGQQVQSVQPVKQVHSEHQNLGQPVQSVQQILPQGQQLKLGQPLNQERFLTSEEQLKLIGKIMRNKKRINPLTYIMNNSKFKTDFGKTVGRYAKTNPNSVREIVEKTFKEQIYLKATNLSNFKRAGYTEEDLKPLQNIFPGSNMYDQVKENIRNAKTAAMIAQLRQPNVIK